MTKKDIEVLLACVEAAKVAPEAMICVGLAWANGQRILKEMQEGDTLIIFTPNQATAQGEAIPKQSK